MEDQKREEAHRDRWFREPEYNHRRNERKGDARPESPDPRTKGFVSSGPPCSQPATEYLEWEIDQNSNSEVFASQALLDHFKGGNGLVSCATNFREYMHDNEGLDIYIP